MIPPPLLGAVGNEPDDRTDEQPRSAHLSKKDLRYILLALVLLLAILTPVYISMRRQAEKHGCLNNLKAVNQAMLQYAATNGDQLPPVFQNYGGAPYLENGAAITWVSQVSEYLDPRQGFFCPSATPEENSRSVGTVRTASGEMRSGAVPSSFGMYAAYSAYPISLVANPSRTVLLAETSNRGARGTYDPLPLTGPDGQPAPYDGMVIGWDTSNWGPEPGTKAVTRLAFYEPQGGRFPGDGPARHEQGLHFLFIDGHYETLKPAAARVRMTSAGPTGRWQTPPSVLGSAPTPPPTAAPSPAPRATRPSGRR